MEIVCMEKRAFDEICNHISELEARAAALYRPCEDLALKGWLDNQDVCDILRVSKRTLQMYRDKGLIPFSRIKHKFFYKPEDVQQFMDSRHNPSKEQRK